MDHSEENIVGSGTYGQVSRYGDYAYKKFKNIRSCIREYIAGNYLSNCPHIVQYLDIDIKNITIKMTCYDMDLQEYLNNYATKGDYSILARDILEGLIHIHDLGLVHSDFKPNNIMVKTKPLNAFIGDLGFTNVQGLSKPHLTARNYRDPSQHDSWTHDIYSLGITFIEMFGNIKFESPLDCYEEYCNVINERIKSRRIRKLIRLMIHPDHEKRPTSRHIYKLLFNKDCPSTYKCHIHRKDSINYMKKCVVNVFGEYNLPEQYLDECIYIASNILGESFIIQELIITIYIYCIMSNCKNISYKDVRKYFSDKDSLIKNIERITKGKSTCVNMMLK
jgi:serine/threonine protein kinase